MVETHMDCVLDEDVPVVWQLIVRSNHSSHRILVVEVVEAAATLHED
jgi:hypothetical protein